MNSPNAGQIEVLAGVTVAATMVARLMSPDGINDVKRDIERPENNLSRYPDIDVQTRLLDCAVDTATGATPDFAWLLELEGMDLLPYKVAMNDLLPTILAHTDTQGVATELFGLQQAAKNSSGPDGQFLAAAWELSTKAFATLEYRQRQ